MQYMQMTRRMQHVSKLLHKQDASTVQAVWHLAAQQDVVHALLLLTQCMLNITLHNEL
jgi:hypothetical protein